MIGCSLHCVGEVPIAVIGLSTVLTAGLTYSRCGLTFVRALGRSEVYT
jgi:hypothetical protein